MCDCKHDRGFTLYMWKDPPNLGIFLCNGCMEFWMNFDPDHYLDGVAYVDKGNPNPGPVLKPSLK